MKNRNNVTHEYKLINTKDILADELYQREINPKRIAQMAKKYDPCLVNAPKLSFRDGKYYVFDGRHTTVLEKTVRGKGKDVTIECKVFYGLTRFDEMDLFTQQNGIVGPVLSPDKLRALYNFGDPDVVGMVNDASRVGVTIDFKSSPGVCKTVAYATIRNIYLRFVKYGHRELYGEMLNTIRLAWGGMPESFTREILSGMAKFFMAYHGEFKTKELIKSLGRVSPVTISREGKSLVSSAGENSYARVILSIYNQRRHSNRLEDKL